MGLLPDAQPHASHPDAQNARGARPGARQGPRRYSGFVNARNRVTCHPFKGALFLGRDGRGALIAAARYMAMNPVTARLVERAEHWPWSSVRAHLIGRNDRLVEVAPALSRCGGRFADLIAEEVDAALVAALRAAETFGRPLAPPSFSTGSRRSPAAIAAGKARPQAAAPRAGRWLTGQTLLFSKKDRHFLDRCVVVLYLFASRHRQGEARVPRFRRNRSGCRRSQPIGRGAARLAKAKREEPIVALSNRGASIAGAGENFFPWTPRNPLKSPELDEGIQENPSPFSLSGLDWLWFGLEEFGPRRCGVGPLLLARLSVSGRSPSPGTS